MKKNIKSKIAKPEALYDSQVIAETSKVLLSFLQILKKQKVITVDNFLYCIEQMEIFDYNCSTFNYFFWELKTLILQIFPLTKDISMKILMKKRSYKKK